MKQLARYAARSAAAVIVLAIIIGPVVAVAAAAGNPFPADLFDRIGGRNVNDATIVKLLSLCFYVCWAWFCLPALRQLLPAPHRHPRARTATRRPAMSPVPTPPAPPSIVGPTRGPRAALARLARFAVSSAAIVSTLTAIPSGVAASARPHAAVATLVPDATTSDLGPAAPGPVTDSAMTLVARHRDTPYAIAHRHFSPDQLDAARDEILELNLGRVLPDGTTYRGGGFPAGWDVIVPATAGDAPPDTSTATVDQTGDPLVNGGHVVTDNESYWSISEDQLRDELGREPSPREVLERTERAIASTAPRLGYADPNMLHPGDIVDVDAATLPATPDEPGATASDPLVNGGHVVTDSESYWSISEEQLRNELGREPSPREVLERTEVAIVFNAPRLGYADPAMLHPGDIVHVDAATLSPATPSPAPAPPLPAEPAVPAEPVVPVVTGSGPAGNGDGSEPVAVPVTAPTTVTDAANDDDVQAPSMPVSTTLPAPDSTATSAPPPVTTAPRVRDEVSVDSEDMLSSRWLFGGIGVTSLGLVGAWMTLKSKRRRRRRWLGVDPSPRLITAPTGRERAAQSDVDLLHELVDVDLVDPPARAVLLGKMPEIWFRDPVSPPPPGWELIERRWRRVNADEPLSGATVLSAALVTIGFGTDDSVSEVLLDLLSAGTVSVTGDRVAVERLVCSMLWELASDPLGGGVDLHVVGLACVAARHATNAGRVVSLDYAIAVAQAPRAGAAQVFLVDPFADETTTGNLRDLVAACTPGSGRAVVVAGPCEHPVEQISVPSARRVLWDELTLAAPQLPETVDFDLGQMLDAIDVGRRDPTVSVFAGVPDPEVEALALRSTSTLTSVGGFERVEDEAFPDEHDDAADNDGPASPLIGDDPVGDQPFGVDPVELPAVVLAVCGREVTVQGHPVPQAAAVLFLLAAAGRAMHSSELSELTGYAPKSLSTVFTASHDLVERDSGSLRLAAHVITDHAWATRCLTQLADAMKVDADSPETTRWMLAAFDAIRALEQAPFAVLPTTRDRGRTAWAWVDDFPADVPARPAAATEIAEAVLAFSELWLAAPSTHRVVRRDELVAELCRLAATIPFAHVGRQLRQSMWVSGAECLLSAAARVADGDDLLLGRVQQTARALAARDQLEASDALADELGL